MTASFHRHVECVQHLLSRGARVDACAVDSQSALLEACETGVPECVEILLAAGADVTLCNCYGHDALRLASDGGHDECVALLRAHMKRAERNRLIDTAIGLAALDLPVLLVYAIYKRAAVHRDERVRRFNAWQIAKCVKEQT